MSKSVVLYSGGLDSTVVLANELAARADVLAVTFDYGQSNRAEVDCCRRLASLWGFKHKVIPLHMECADARQEIPARNTVFLAKALEQALIFGAKTVLYGAEPDARCVDGSVDYIEAMNRVFQLHGVGLLAPVKRFESKTAILRCALDLGVPLDLVHSSFTNSVNAGCFTSANYLKALHGLFPAVNPVELLQHIRDGHAACTDHNPFDLRAPVGASFKFFSCLLLLAGLPACNGAGKDAPRTRLQVYTTGNAGRAMQEVRALLRLETVDLDIYHTWDPERWAQNTLNTDHERAQWGIKQALSRLPRPQFMSAPLSFIVRQGHLRKAILDLGYQEDHTQGLPLITGWAYEEGYVRRHEG